MGPRFIFHPTEERLVNIRHQSEKANVPVAEVLRRMMDFCSQEYVINQLLPHVSGQLKVEK